MLLEIPNQIITILNRLLQSIFKLTPQGGVIYISTQPADQNGEFRAAIEMSSIYPESETSHNTPGDHDFETSSQAHGQLEGFLDEMKEMAVSLKGIFNLESIPGRSITYKLFLPVESRAA